MGAMDWDEGFGSAGDFYGSPDYPDVHREWVRREWVSGSQGIVNQHSPSGRMGVPRLFDYAGLSHCMLLPDVPHAICENTEIHRAPATVPAPPATPTPVPVSTTTNVDKVFGVAMAGLIGATVLIAIL
jgi:hypothetical protein